MKIELFPINVDNQGNAPTIVSGYYKFGFATLLGGGYGVTGAAVIEICDEERFDTLGDMGRIRVPDDNGGL